MINFLEIEVSNSRTSNPKDVVEEILIHLSKTYSQGRQTGPNV